MTKTVQVAFSYVRKPSEIPPLALFGSFLHQNTTKFKVEITFRCWHCFNAIGMKEFRQKSGIIGVCQNKNASFTCLIRAEDDGSGGDNWSYRTCRAPVKSSPPKKQHPALYRPDAFPVAKLFIKRIYLWYNPGTVTETKRVQCVGVLVSEGWQGGMATLPQGNQELLVVRDKVGRPQVNLGWVSPWNVIFFPSELWRCWLGDRKGIRPVKSWMLVCWWWWFDWSFARFVAPVVTTTSIILCFNKHRLSINQSIIKKF